jgi:hypothetical protein
MVAQRRSPTRLTGVSRSDMDGAVRLITTGPLGVALVSYVKYILQSPPATPVACWLRDAFGSGHAGERTGKHSEQGRSHKMPRLVFPQNNVTT